MTKSTLNLSLNLSDVGQFTPLSDTENHIVYGYLRDSITKVLPHPNKDQWNEYWSEAKTHSYLSTSFCFRGLATYRWNGGFVKGNKDLGRMFHDYVIDKISSLIKTKTVFEFGCGSGDNLDLLKSKGFEVKGFDFSEAAVNNVKSKGIDACVIDMSDPYPVDGQGKTFITVGSMEQLDAWSNFYNFLLSSKPDKIIHVEPIYELYSDSEFDSLAKIYHENKKYFSGYLDHLLRQHSDVKFLRTGFGTIHNEGFNIITWTP